MKYQNNLRNLAPKYQIVVLPLIPKIISMFSSLVIPYVRYMCNIYSLIGLSSIMVRSIKYN